MRYLCEIEETLAKWREEGIEITKISIIGYSLGLSIIVGPRLSEVAWFLDMSSACYMQRESSIQLLQ